MEKKERLIKNVFLLFFVIFTLSACVFGEDEDSLRWQDEVLLAQECGEIGLMCCIEKDPPCKYGPCCFDPNDPSRTMCMDECEHGAVDNFCQLGNICLDGLACHKGMCLSCGEMDQPCCDGNCGSDLACFRGMCVACGESGAPCCQGDSPCNFAGDNSSKRNECFGGMCELCGADGNQQCLTEPTCNDNHLLNNGKCFRCGAYNQPCCKELVAPGETRKYCIEEDLECKLDFCSR